MGPDKSTVTFEDITFSYIDNANILNGLSFQVPAGKKIAIVGGSGSGYFRTYSINATIFTYYNI